MTHPPDPIDQHPQPASPSRSSSGQTIRNGAPITLPEILKITRADIERMEEAFDSPMCDIGSRNAAALALSRALNGVPVRICPHETTTTETVAEVGGARIALPPALDRWLRHAIHGLQVKPRSFFLRKKARAPEASPPQPPTRRARPSAAPTSSSSSTTTSKKVPPKPGRITRTPRHR